MGGDSITIVRCSIGLLHKAVSRSCWFSVLVAMGSFVVGKRGIVGGSASYNLGQFRETAVNG